MIEVTALQDLKVKQDLRDPWVQLEPLVHPELEGQANQVQMVSQESQVAQVEMALPAPWDHRDLRVTPVPQV